VWGMGPEPVLRSGSPAARVCVLWSAGFEVGVPSLVGVSGGRVLWVWLVPRGGGRHL
jgi:hypothetical protein